MVLVADGAKQDAETELGGQAAPSPKRYWTFAEVEQALIDMLELWRRSPRVGHGSLKSAWPDARRFENRAAEIDAMALPAPDPRPLPLTRAEVAFRDRVSLWLELIPLPINRRIVKLAIAQRVAGHSQISWKRIMKDRAIAGRLIQPKARGTKPGEKPAAAALRARYSAAITAICVALEKGKG
jgi:hypothetical protein